MKKENLYLLLGIGLGMILLIGIDMAVFFHSPQEFVSFYEANLDGKKAYWITPSVGGGPHLSCTDYEYIDGTAICYTADVWRFNEIYMEYNWDQIAKNRKTDINAEQCKMAYAYLESYCKKENQP